MRLNTKTLPLMGRVASDSERGGGEVGTFSKINQKTETPPPLSPPHKGEGFAEIFLSDKPDRSDGE
jgi:hypothetical protein